MKMFFHTDFTWFLFFQLTNDNTFRFFFVELNYEHNHFVDTYTSIRCSGGWMS